MANPQSFEPNEQSQQAMGSIPGLRFTPGPVFALDGPNGLGPESAGAVLILHATLVDEAGAQIFYQRNAELMRTLYESRGFIRFIGLGDGPSMYGLGFWKTRDDAIAFAHGPMHSAVVRDLAKTPFQYSQFAGIWTAETQRPRRFYCDKCSHATAAPAEACAHCGNPLTDVFREQART
jgi:hypothetical protein